MMVPSSQQQQQQYGDMLGFDAPTQQQQPLQPQPPHQQVINATQATVSITTSNAAVAPNIAVLGKIEPSAQNTGNTDAQLSQSKRKVIYVPTYSCNGGFDTKFNHYARQARPSHLHNLLTPTEYKREITMLNERIKKARANKCDYALLGMGPLMVPLIPWAIRHSKQVKRRRKLIEEGVEEFNDRMAMDGRNVCMMWNRSRVTGATESYLTIEESDHETGDALGKKMD